MSKLALKLLLVFVGLCALALTALIFLGPQDVRLPWLSSRGTSSRWTKEDFETLEKLSFFLRTTETRSCVEAQQKFAGLPRRQQLDAWGREMQVICIHGGWEIRSLGEDGELVTGDDLAEDTVELDRPRD